MKRVLLMRFSALGDVAIAAPLLYAYASVHSDVHFYVCTQAAFKPIFDRCPGNVHVLPALLKTTHRGLFGLWRLSGEMHALAPDAVCDLHDVLRSRLIGFFLRLRGYSVFRIDKGRADKKRLVRKRHKVFKALPTSLQRYQHVLEAAGLMLPKPMSSFSPLRLSAGEVDVEALFGRKTTLWIGVAAFARHLGKRYPLERMESVLDALDAHSDYSVFLLGAGKDEKEQMQKWVERWPRLRMAGKNLHEDLTLMQHLDLLLTMDSANMHLGAMMGTRVLSIWGATHPNAGFTAWNQRAEDQIQVGMNCRPCSVFGNKPCFRNDYACLHRIEPTHIVKRIETCLNEKK